MREISQKRKWKVKLITLLMIVLCLAPVTPVLAAKKKTKLNTTKITMTVGQKKTLSLKNYPKISKKQIKKVKWKISNKKIISVKASGKYRQKCVVKAKKKGTATVRVTFKGKTYKCKVVVKEKKKPDKEKPYLRLPYTVIDVLEGKSTKIKVEASHPNNLKWSTTSSCITVDQSGNVKAIQSGIAYVAIEDTKNNLKVNICVNVKQSVYKPRYSYECVFLTDLYNGGFYVYGMFGEGLSAVYIKTDNPNPDTIDLKMTGNDGKEYPILGRFGVGAEFYDIAYKTTADEGKKLRAVEGGYIGFVNTNIKWMEKEPTYGNVLITVEEYNKDLVDLDGKYFRCAAARQQTEYLYSYDAQMDAWMDEVIAQCTTEDMNVHEKMTAISSYLYSEFTYLPNDGEHLMYSAIRIGPSFKIKAWDSYQSPAALCKFGEKLGYKLENMYFSGDWSMHYYAKGVFEGKTYYYQACPYATTGYVDKNTIEKIDLSKY